VLSVSVDSFDQEVLSSPVPVIVSFWAPWCGVCRTVEPVMKQLEAGLGTPLKLVKINADENLRLANCYRLTTLPTLLVFDQGQVIFRLDGLHQVIDLKATLNEQLSGVAIPKSA
jgi:thioredoxin 1